MSEYLVHFRVYKGRMTVTYMAKGRLARGQDLQFCVDETGMLYPFAAMWVHHEEVLENECSFRDVVEKILNVRRSNHTC